MHPLITLEAMPSMFLEALINTPTKACSSDSPTTSADLSVYNHVLKLDLNNLQWSLVDNYGDIPGVRMGALMGGGVGLTIGFIFGSWSIIRCVHPLLTVNRIPDRSIDMVQDLEG